MPYKRIVSLVPSLTELLIDLGLANLIVGRTKFCIHPSTEVNEIPVIGGTKNPSLDIIRSLHPDLILANKEENRKEDIEELQELADVIVTNISTIDEAICAISLLGKRLQKQEDAETLIVNIKNSLRLPSYTLINVAYFIWKDPWMTIGADTYIHDVMKRFGLCNIYNDQTRYPHINIDDLETRDPQLILLSSEPFPFKEKHISDLQNKLPNSTIQLVDGEWFSWYGSRMLPAFKQLKTWRENLSI